MVLINYITNLDVDNISGGWSGMNHHVYEQLKKQFDVHPVQKIDPPYLLSERVVSRAFRVAGVKGIFPAFTRRRLDTIKKQVESRVNNKAQLHFYHGATPWLHVNNNVPYAAYLDCCFGSYISVYHNSDDFNGKQLDELFEQESKFLNDASNVFFSSRWALEDAQHRYNMDGKNFCVAGLGGGLNFGDTEIEQPKSYFLFIGMDFFGKGGDIVVEAFEQVKREYPEFSLKVAGQEPPEKFKAFVDYEGVFNKSDETQLNKLKQLFAEAYCFVLPTSKDMTPLVLVEASSAGCPVIATERFGIPEMVINNETGILLNVGQPIKEQLVSAMKRMISNKEMRKNFAAKSREFVLHHFSWDKAGNVIREKLFESFPAWNEQQ